MTNSSVIEKSFSFLGGGRGRRKLDGGRDRGLGLS